MAESWYAKGLRFRCTGCGNCCTGAPGRVRVSDAEIERLAGRFGVSPDEFRAMYTRTLRGGDVSLKERRGGDCVFYRRGRGCSVYADRPRQCRTWPFWNAVVDSEERWSDEARDCPGMNQGPVHPASLIAALREDDGTSL